MQMQVEDLVCEVMIYAYEVEMYNGVAQYALLNELGRSLIGSIDLQVSQLKDGYKRVVDLALFATTIQINISPLPQHLASVCMLVNGSTANLLCSRKPLQSDHY